MKHPSRFALQVVKAFRANQGLALSFEIAATLLLLGAQVVAEYERLDKGEGLGVRD